MSETFTSTADYSADWSSGSVTESAGEAHTSPGVSRATPIAQVLQALGEARRRRTAELTAASMRLVESMEALESPGASAYAPRLSRDRLARAQIESLGDVPDLERLLGLDACPELTEARTVLSACAADRLGDGRTAADAVAAAAARLEHEIERVVVARVASEEQFVRGAVLGVLAEMGFEPAAARRRSRHGLLVRGSRRADRTAIWLAFDARRGRLLVDFSGFRGLECTSARREFVARLQRAGVRLNLVALRRHAFESGGDYVAEWARMFEPSGDRPVRPSTVAARAQRAGSSS